MSWDLYVQDLPHGIQNVAKIPPDFEPRELGTRAVLIAQIQRLLPECHFSNSSLGCIEADDYSIEIELGDTEVVTGIALHIRGDERAAYLVQYLLEGLQLHALDPSSDTGVFSLHAGSLKGFARWRSYRNRLIDGQSK